MCATFSKFNEFSAVQSSSVQFMFIQSVVVLACKAISVIW